MNEFIRRWEELNNTASVVVAQISLKYADEAFGVRTSPDAMTLTQYSTMC